MTEKIEQYKKHILERNCRFLDVENYSLEQYLDIDSWNYGMNYKDDEELVKKAASIGLIEDVNNDDLDEDVEAWQKKI